MLIATEFSLFLSRISHGGKKVNSSSETQFALWTCMVWTFPLFSQGLDLSQLFPSWGGHGYRKPLSPPVAMPRSMKRHSRAQNQYKRETGVTFYSQAPAYRI